MPEDTLTILSITAQKPHSTGSGTYLTELVRSFERRGIHQGVVAGIYRSDQVDFPDHVSFYPVYYTHPGDQYIEGDISFPVLGMSDVMPYTSTRYQDLTADMANEMREKFIAAIRVAVAELDPDIILCHHLFLLTAYVREAFPDRFVLGLCHGSDLRQMENCIDRYENYCTGHLDSDYIAKGISRLDRILLLHSAQIDIAKEIYGASQETIRVIGTGYNSSIFHIENEADSYENPLPIRLIYAGKICKEKGIAELLEALDLISEANDKLPPLRLSLAGGCKDSDIRRGILQRAGLVGDEAALPQGILQTAPYEIEYLGLLPHHELADAFRRSDIFVLPSFYEGLPLVLIEAMACGLETVCTDLPGVAEWVSRAITNPNTAFIPMPEMATIDAPDPAHVEDFVRNLGDVLMEKIVFCQNKVKADRKHPDTSKATWDAVADRVLENLTKTS